MKTPDEILAKTGNGLPQPSWTSRIPTGKDAEENTETVFQISVETKKLVNMIFARFMAIYGHKFKSSFETENEIRLAKREWALSLSGYHERELVTAVNHCKEHLAWMPSVSEFLEVLHSQQGAAGFPIALSAYQEACMHAMNPLAHSWSHPCVYYAAKEIGWLRLRSDEQSSVFPDFAQAYSRYCHRVRNGEEFTVPAPVAIEDKSDNVLAVFIQAYAKQHRVHESVLYYLTKPMGSRIRERLKSESERQLHEQGRTIKLPERPV